MAFAALLAILCVASPAAAEGPPVQAPQGRHSRTLWVSFDGGQTWPLKRLVEKGGFAYSSLAAGPPEPQLLLSFALRESGQSLLDGYSLSK